VRIACGLVLTSLAVGVLTMLPGVRRAEAMPAGSTAIEWLAYAGFVALAIWFTRRSWQGRRWARWALLVYLAIGWAMYALTLSDEMVAAPMAALVNTLCLAMELSACGLLFFGAGARWFAALRSAARLQTA
jgi:hypothetical protein